MYTKDTQSPLLPLTRTAFQNDSPIKPPITPIQKYNYFIENYNVEGNRVNGITLDEIGEPAIFRYFWRVFSSVWLLIIFLGLILVPVLGLVLYLGMTLGVVIYLSALQTFNRNQDKVSDPFQNMIFCPEMCRIAHLCNKFFEIRVEELESFALNKEIITQIKSCADDDEVKFMVYDGLFWDYYHNLPKYKGRFMALWILGSALVIIQWKFLIDLFSGTNTTV